MNLKSTIESILFTASRPVSLNELVKATEQSKEEVLNSLKLLAEARKESGIVLLEQNNKYLLSTNPETSDKVSEFLNSELRETLSDASLETLAIVTYKQPVSRAEIEAIRGVNSQYTLRLLMIRGLIEKAKSGNDQRIQLYKTTHEFLQHMGITNITDLPSFEDLTAKVKPPEGFSEKGEDLNSPNIDSAAPEIQS